MNAARFSSAFLSASLFLVALPLLLPAATLLPEFAYREVTVAVSQTDGQPAASIPLYGFCREFNLVWPRHDTEWQRRNDVVWNEGYLGHTGADGRAKVVVPPGRWGFFAAGRLSGGIVVAWSDFSERTAGTTVVLAAKAVRQWRLAAPGGASLTPARLFFKPDQFPIWIPVAADPTTEALRVQMSRGALQLWASGDASLRQPAFALAFGTVTDGTADGPRTPATALSTINCNGGDSRTVLLWQRRDGFGLAGETRLTNPAQVIVSPGVFTLAYRRPLAGGLTGRFVGQRYELGTNGVLSLNLSGQLAAALDHDLGKPDKKGRCELAARLYVVDPNGHLLAEAVDSAGVAAPFHAAVTVAGRRFPSVASDPSGVLGQGERGQTFFKANIGTLTNANGAIWEVNAPPGLLPQTRFPESEMIVVRTRSYNATVPRVLGSHARNVLDQMELLAGQIEQITVRKRRKDTTIYVKPGRSGAYATSGGVALGIGSALFFSDNPIARHDTVHETCHNYDFKHGGLQETVVEIVRCFDQEQVSQQPAKWMFFDRMNGRQCKEVLYPNTGLYLYGSAQGKDAFLRFILANDKSLSDKLARAGFSQDEATAACLSLALDRDMARVCASYGLRVTASRVADAAAAARPLVRR